MQRAFLTRLEDDGSTSCVASGEYREEEGVFAVELVDPDHAHIDLAGAQLGNMIGGVVALEDVGDADLDLEFDDAEQPADSTGLLSPGEMPSAEAQMVQVETREGATSPPPRKLMKLPFHASDIRIRPETSDGSLSKLVNMDEWLRTCYKAGMKRPPVLTPSERVREAKQTAGSWQVHYNNKSQELETARAALAMERARFEQELALQREAHARELDCLRAQHAEDLEAVRVHERLRGSQHVSAVKQWASITKMQLRWALLGLR